MQPAEKRLNGKTSKLAPDEKRTLAIRLLFSFLTELNERIRQQDRFKDKPASLRSPSLAKGMLQDILASEIYSLEGIEYYTNVPLDVLIDIITEVNMSPSIETVMKLLELHIEVKREWYEQIGDKFLAILNEHQTKLDKAKKPIGELFQKK